MFHLRVREIITGWLYRESELSRLAAPKLIVVPAVAFLIAAAPQRVVDSGTTLDRVSPASQGPPLSSTDPALLSEFRGRLLATLPPDLRDTRKVLRATLLSEFAAKKHLIATRFPQLSERQRLVLFTMLRVHGSFPTYAIRSMVPRTLDKILLSHRGNCSDHALRLALALDALDLETAFVPIKTDSIPGHVIVDAFDPAERTAYLLDSNLNVFIRRPGATASFLTEWVGASEQARSEFFADSGNLYELPLHFEFEDPGPLGFTGGAPTLDQLNSVVPKRRQMWRRAFTVEFDQVLRWWRTSWPYQPPRSLIELGRAFDLIGLVQFQPHWQVAVEPLWKAANVTRFDPSRHVAMASPPLED